jgi:hypothetical protein
MKNFIINGKLYTESEAKQLALKSDKPIMIGHITKIEVFQASDIWPECVEPSAINIAILSTFLEDDITLEMVQGRINEGQTLTIYQHKPSGKFTLEDNEGTIAGCGIVRMQDNRKVMDIDEDMLNYWLNNYKI